MSFAVSGEWPDCLKPKDYGRFSPKATLPGQPIVGTRFGYNNNLLAEAAGAHCNQSGLGRRHHLHPDSFGNVWLLCGAAGSLLSPHRRLVVQTDDD